MNASLAITPAVDERFARFDQINWWNQRRLSQARVLVIGAGALGNEVVKNLALLGVGRLAIVDRDCVERSNLSRSVLFREADAGRPKAECAARAAREIYPGLAVEVLVGNVLADVGLGWFRWADVVVGALDNREARLFVNGVCARLGRVWIDGGIDVFQGVVRGFSPPKTACYECTMGEADWKLVNQRRSCGLLAARAASLGGTPTTPTVASVIGALQAQEVVKLLHGMEALLGEGYVFDGAHYQSYRVNYPVSPDCPWHEGASAVEQADDLSSDSPWNDVWLRGASLLGGLDAIDFSREIVAALRCRDCGRRREVWAAAENVKTEDLRCRECGGECWPDFIHSLDETLPRDRTPREAGLPPWDILWARRGERIIGIELAGDAREPTPATERNERHVAQVN
ncbi:MAG TPA: ThiF family adenylyltransferase [Pirellulales bacterium]